MTQVTSGLVVLSDSVHVDNGPWPVDNGAVCVSLSGNSHGVHNKGGHCPVSTTNKIIEQAYVLLNLK